MNGLDELRTTLDRHASGVVDHDLAARVGSVRHRVHVVRRRRRAAVAGAAGVTALAVVAGIAVLNDPAQREAEPATVAGMEVPSTMSALGYTYGFDRGAEGEGRARVELGASDVPRLVSWGTAGEDDRVRVTRAEGTAGYDVRDFSDYVLVSPGDPTTVTVAGTGRLGIAVYELTDDRPPGVTAGGVTYREEVAGARLVAARVGEPGSAEVTVPARAPGTGVTLSAFCAGGGEDVVVHLETPDGEIVTGGCDETVPFDPADRSGVGFATTPGEDVTTRVWASRGEDGPMLEDEDLRLGIGVYAAAPGERATGVRPPTLLEYDGHLWRRADVARPGPGKREVVVSGPEAARPVLAYGVWSGGGDVVAGLSEGGSDFRSNGIDGSAPIGLLSGFEDRASVRFVGEVPASARTEIVLYERAD